MGDGSDVEVATGGDGSEDWSDEEWLTWRFSDDNVEGEGWIGEKQEREGDEDDDDQDGPQSFWDRVSLAVGQSISAVKNSIISRETATSYRIVASILRQFFADVPVGKLKLLYALRLLAAYVDDEDESIAADAKHPHEETDQSFLQQALKYMKYTSAAYGWVLVEAKMMRGKVREVHKWSNTRTLLEHTGVTMEDVLIQEWESSSFLPAHILVADHATSSLVLAFRGTFGVMDTVTDLVGHYEPCDQGAAHCGMITAGKQVVRRLTPILEEHLTSYPEYRLVVCGHSLGGGTATAATYLWHRDSWPDKIGREVICFAFGPPPVFSLDLASKCSYINTACYGSLEELKVMVVDVLEHHESFFQIVWQNAKRRKTFDLFTRGNTNVHNDEESNSEQVCTVSRPEITTTRCRLSLAGSVYHLLPDACGGLHRYIMRPSQSFDRIRLSPSMFLHHLPGRYEMALNDPVAFEFEVIGDYDEERLVEHE